jgi:hypothetical protein
MAKTYVLDRVAADLARGLTHPAIQRLSSLVAAYPNDLDLRRRLAAVHRRVGNRIQAGRWDYLTIGADVHDTRAFERAFPSAIARLREVWWPHRAGHAATAYARSRLAKLVAAAEAERPARPGRGTRSGSGTARRSALAVTWLAAAPAATRRLAAGSLAWAVARGRQLRQTPRTGAPGTRRLHAGLLLAGAVALALVLVGLVTVIEWIVQ